MLDLFVGIQVMFGHHALVIYREWTKTTCLVMRWLYIENGPKTHVVYVGLWYMLRLVGSVLGICLVVY